MRQGKIPVVTAADRFGAERRMVRHRDAQVFLAEQRARWSLTDAADELGVSYQEARKTFHRLGLEAARSPSGEHHLDETAIAALRAEFDRIALLHERSIRVSDAARQLHVVPDTVYKAIRRGELERDAETDGTGARYVTRYSLHTYRDRVLYGRHSSARVHGDVATDEASHSGDGLDTALIPLSYIKEITGLTSVQLKSLADARHLHFATRRRRTYLTRESVERWASGYRPDLLVTLQNRR